MGRVCSVPVSNRPVCQGPVASSLGALVAGEEQEEATVGKYEMSPLPLSINSGGKGEGRVSGLHPQAISGSPVVGTPGQTTGSFLRLKPQKPLCCPRTWWDLNRNYPGWGHQTPSARSAGPGAPSLTWLPQPQETPIWCGGGGRGEISRTQGLLPLFLTWLLLPRG